MDIEIYVPRSLLWLQERHDRYPGRTAELAEFTAAEGLPLSAADVLVGVLEERSYIEPSPSLAGRGTAVFLTDTGKVQAAHLGALKDDRAAKVRYSRDALLQWMYRQTESSGWTDVQDFVRDPSSFFVDQQLTVDEILRALAYLEERGLARRSYGGAGLLSTEAELTADGQDCALQGGNVSDYINRSQGGGTNYNFHNSTGIVAGSQQQVTQTNNVGFDPSQLAALAKSVQQFAPVLQLDDQSRDALIEDAQALNEAATADQPEPSRIRRAADRVLGGLRTASALTAGATTLYNQGEQTYRSVFGG